MGGSNKEDSEGMEDNGTDKAGGAGRTTGASFAPEAAAKPVFLETFVFGFPLAIFVGGRGRGGGGGGRGATAVIGTGGGNGRERTVEDEGMVENEEGPAK